MGRDAQLYGIHHSDCQQSLTFPDQYQGSKRKRLAEDEEAKKRKAEIDGHTQQPIYATQFSAEDIASEQKRPKKKTAVLIGYSGAGYYGMQLCVTRLLVLVMSNAL